MESQVVLIIGLAFVAALGFILKQANTTPAKAIKEKPARREKPAPKAKRPSSKKGQRRGVEEIKEWVGVDTAAKDAQDMLEFLKGRDPKEISKALKAQNPKPKATVQPVAPVVQNNKKGKNQKQQAQNESANDAIEEGFSVIQKKAPKEKKDNKKKNKQAKEAEVEENAKVPRQKSFFRAEEEAIQKERKERKEARALAEKEGRPYRDERPREDRPKRERREKKEGEDSNTESDSERTPKQRRERREKTEGESERPPRVIVAPNIPKYEAPELDDVLSLMTSSYKATPAAPKQQRETSVFSKIPRDIMADRILCYLSARDLLTLARVNQFFKAAVKTDRIWKNLYLKEFGPENTAGIKSWMREYKKRKTGKGARAAQADNGNKAVKEEKKGNNSKQ